MASSVPEAEIVFEETQEFSDANNVLLMSLMEETQDDEYYGDDRLVSMIQSLEAEITDPLLGQSYKTAHADGHDFSTSFVDDYSWVNMEVGSSSAFEEMNAWSPCGNEMEGMEGIAMEYGAGNDSDYSEFYYYGVLLEQQYRETYLPQEPTNVLS